MRSRIQKGLVHGRNFEEVLQLSGHRSFSSFHKIYQFSSWECSGMFVFVRPIVQEVLSDGQARALVILVARLTPSQSSFYRCRAVRQSCPRHVESPSPLRLVVALSIL